MAEKKGDYVNEQDSSCFQLSVFYTSAHPNTPLLSFHHQAAVIQEHPPAMATGQEKITIVIYQIFNTIIALLESYGWYLVIATLLGIYLGKF